MRCLEPLVYITNLNLNTQVLDFVQFGGSGWARIASLDLGTPALYRLELRDQWATIASSVPRRPRRQYHQRVCWLIDAIRSESYDTRLVWVCRKSGIGKHTCSKACRIHSRLVWCMGSPLRIKGRPTPICHPASSKNAFPCAFGKPRNNATDFRYRTLVLHLNGNAQSVYT